MMYYLGTFRQNIMAYKEKQYYGIISRNKSKVTGSRNKITE